MLQAHLDMVCEADATAGTDPAIDGVFPQVVDGWVHAPGTTLGADDGIGVAIALAIAAEAAQEALGERRRSWPPLQLLFTVDEEEDFTGAARVDRSLVTGKVLLNLDAEAEHQIVIGSAGGSRVLLHVPADWQPAPAGGTVVELRVHGLQGGHSGHQIGDNVMNALKALAYTLAGAAAALGPQAAGELRVADLRGGRADNAIPREARGRCSSSVRPPERPSSAPPPTSRSGSAPGVRATTRPSWRWWTRSLPMSGRLASCLPPRRGT